MPREEERLRLGKRSSFVKGTLKRLRQEDETWEADFQALPKPIKQSQTHYRGMVVAPDGSLLANSHIEGRPTVNDMATLEALTKRASRKGAMEDFHCQHLSDAQMKELNPIIRRAIYETLCQLYFLKKGTKKQRLVAIQSIHHLFLLLPDYWEVPDLTEEKRAEEDKLAEMDMTKRMGLFGSERSATAFVAFFQQQLDVFG